MNRSPQVISVCKELFSCKAISENFELGLIVLPASFCSFGAKPAQSNQLDAIFQQLTKSHIIV